MLSIDFPPSWGGEIVILRRFGAVWGRIRRRDTILIDTYGFWCLGCSLGMVPPNWSRACRETVRKSTITQLHFSRFWRFWGISLESAVLVHFTGAVKCRLKSQYWVFRFLRRGAHKPRARMRGCGRSERTHEVGRQSRWFNASHVPHMVLGCARGVCSGPWCIEISYTVI